MSSGLTKLAETIFEIKEGMSDGDYLSLSNLLKDTYIEINKQKKETNRIMTNVHSHYKKQNDEYCLRLAELQAKMDVAEIRSYDALCYAKSQAVRIWGSRCWQQQRVKLLEALLKEKGALEDDQQLVPGDDQLDWGAMGGDKPERLLCEERMCEISGEKYYKSEYGENNSMLYSYPKGDIVGILNEETGNIQKVELVTSADIKGLNYKVPVQAASSDADVDDDDDDEVVCLTKEMMCEVLGKKYYRVKVKDVAKHSWAEDLPKHGALLFSYPKGDIMVGFQNEDTEWGRTDVLHEVSWEEGFGPYLVAN